MKMRIRGNSLRLRLTRSEVTNLVDSGCVEESIGFAPDYALAYRVRIEDGVQVIAARADGHGITVILPGERARGWASSDEVSMCHDQDVGGDEPLRILVEKDFACLVEREGEDDSDAFPHPDGGAC